MKFVSWYFVHAQENVIKIHVFGVSNGLPWTDACVQEKCKIIFFVIVTLRTLNQTLNVVHQEILKKKKKIRLEDYIYLLYLIFLTEVIYSICSYVAQDLKYKLCKVSTMQYNSSLLKILRILFYCNFDYKCLIKTKQNKQTKKKNKPCMATMYQ